MTKNKLYSFLILSCFAGFLYLIYTANYPEKNHFSICLFKNITGFPCPSCGTTRAVELIWQGQFLNSILINPLGILVFIIMTLFPIWILFDVILKKETLFNWYNKVETVLKIKWIATFLVLLILLNWIWNIKKGL